ncbi:MAG: ABC transporter substrate-binding protein [Clostridia bacterium]|nr:ABC transporter substrate-binding protein [Clostridia bacterium]
MKKFIALLLLIFILTATFVACEQLDNDPQSYTMVAPDGAPALAISELMAKNMQFDNTFTYKIVSADDIKNHVVGNINTHADFALLPVNLASKLIGGGDEYKMIAVVTHGNLYFLSKNETAITAENASAQLKGKSIAVVNLSAVPGLTTKALLTKVGLAYTEDISQHTSENVYLKGINGTEIGASLNSENAVDYVVAPEPAVSTITGKAPVIKKVGALHDVYGRYPQAVLVVKASIIEKDIDLVKAVVDAMKGATDYVKANTQSAVDAVASHLPEGTTPSFNAVNTTSAVVDGCGINVKTFDNNDLLQQVKTYINDIIAVNANSAQTFPETFFVNINKVK